MMQSKLLKERIITDAAGLQVSDNNKFMAIGEDDVSRRLYKLRFKNLENG